MPTLVVSHVVVLFGVEILLTLKMIMIARRLSLLLFFAFSSTCYGFSRGYISRVPALSSVVRLRAATAKIEKSEQEWREALTQEQYYVLREEGTEPPNSSTLNTIKDPGTFTCAGCGAPLFTTATKFDSGTGWPSFYAPVSMDATALSTDFKLILPRTECSCAKCGGHLGHVFDDGPNPTGQRFCMNGVAMEFKSEAADPDLNQAVKQEQLSNPYKPGVIRALPTIVLNLLFAGQFFGIFLERKDAGIASIIDLFPFVVAAVCLYVAVDGITKIVLPPSSSPEE